MSRSETRRRVVVVGVRLEPNLFDAGWSHAAAEGRTLPALMRHLLTEYLEPKCRCARADVSLPGEPPGSVTVPGRRHPDCPIHRDPTVSP